MSRALTVADLVVCADMIHTLAGPADSPGEVTAIAIAGDRVMAVGTRDDVPAWAGPETRVVDLGDATAVPGLTDCHVHPILGAELTRGVGLLDLDDLAEVREALAAYAATLPADAWVTAWGLDPNVVPGGRLTSTHIDDVLGGRPALVRLFDAHSALASTEALRLAGVTGPRTFEEAAEVVCDEAGRPTGLLLEMPAMKVVEAAVPETSLRELADLTLAALQRMASLGITSAHALEHQPRAAEVYELLESEGDLPVRLRCSPWCGPETTEQDWRAIADLQDTGGRRWTVRGVKLFIDGTIDNGTAWLAEADTLGESTKPYWPDPAAYAEAIAWFDAHDVPTTTHAIGDQGVRYVLDALERTSGRTRHRVEHIETIPDDLVARFAALGVTASMQPTHGTEYTAADGSDNWSVRLGPARAAQGWRTRDLREAGVRVALGSDWPIADCDPRGVLAASLLQRRGGAPERQPIRPSQSLTALMALEGYTTHAAWSVGDEAIAGTLAPGRRADLTVLRDDPLTADPDDLVTTEVLLSVSSGIVTHEPAGVPLP